MMKSGSERPVYISFDEWGARGRGLVGPLMVALHLNSFVRHETDAIETEVILQTGEFTGNATVHAVNGETLDATNTREKQEVQIATDDIKFQGNTIRYTFPAHSLTQIEVPVACK
jgi:alpha-N-arabinofuranosidase